MLTGTTPLEQLVPKLPHIPTFDIEEVELPNVEILQVQYEVASSQIEAMLPPALHPTIPPLGQWTSWHVSESPWGSFHLMQLRLSCRSGARPRLFLVDAVIDNERAQSALSEAWGFAASLGEIKFERNYDAATVQVSIDDRIVLDAHLRDPESLTVTDIQFFASMHGAETPRGLRLVQFDPNYEVNRAERYKPHINSFDAKVWGGGKINPIYPVIGWGVNATIHLPQIRFVCVPDTSAFQGTELVQQL